MRLWQHFRTITHHRHLVMLGCFRVGLFRQGLLHDLSKYSPTEFLCGAKYYQGVRSPNVAERREKGYSEAWIHHKGRNPHHYEYWTDLSAEGVYAPVKMPVRYVAEMVMDRVAACRTYLGKKYYRGSELDYLDRAVETPKMHPDTVAQLRDVLTTLRDEGEKAMYRKVRGMLKEDRKTKNVR